MNDAAIFAAIFQGEGAVELEWEVGTRCDCYSIDTRQPQWGHVACGGLGCLYAAPVAVRGLFRSRSSWQSRHSSGEHQLGEAQLTLPLAVRPGYTDERIRDRFRVLAAVADVAAGTVFYPQAHATSFLFAGAQRAWRVKVQALDQVTRTLPQP